MILFQSSPVMILHGRGKEGKKDREREREGKRSEEKGREEMEGKGMEGKGMEGREEMEGEEGKKIVHDFVPVFGGDDSAWEEGK